PATSYQQSFGPRLLAVRLHCDRVALLSRGVRTLGSLSRTASRHVGLVRGCLGATHRRVNPLHVGWVDLCSAAGETRGQGQGYEDLLLGHRFLLLLQQYSGLRSTAAAF